MSTLPYAYWCYHLTDGNDWRRVDYNARVVVKGLKQEPFNGYMAAKVGGVEKRFDQENVEQLIDLIMPIVGRQLREDIAGPISIVPIPNSGMAVRVPGEFRTEVLARKVAAGFGAGATVCSAIRWDAPREKAHQNKTYRHPDIFEPHMRLVEAPQSSVVLFDDVLTSGSQMIAAARLLTKSGFPPQRGVVVAKATKVHQDEKFWEKRHGELELTDLPFDFDDL